MINSDGSPQVAANSQLTPADLASPSDFANRTDAPVVESLGSLNQYDRPSRATPSGEPDDDFLDEVQESQDGQPLPIAIEVFEGPPLTVTATASQIVEHARTDAGDHQLNKALADFDFDAQRRLGRTRVLVRAGPALGLRGTLIPLSPALTGLANGNTATLTQDLRVAFSVTVVGLMVGAVAFALSLSRDRMYSQDLSDLQYLAAVINDPRPAAGAR